MTNPGPSPSGDYGPIAELLRNGTLRPPRKPGLLAQLGKYDVLRVIGEGGMGIVVEAATAEDEQVAIKFLRPTLAGDQSLRQQFLREVQMMTKLSAAAGRDNSWFLPILQSDGSAPSPWFAMPLMRHGNLAAKLGSGQSLSSDDVLRITQQIAEGLRFAHDQGILHRDLKPANILLDEKGNARLTDFGLARGFSGDSILGIHDAHLVGTPAYMSPATAEGKAEDTRCDIYSLGAVLYEMLTGTPPYAGETAANILDQIKSGPPQPILKRNPKASPALAKIAEKAMARGLADRYASVDYLLKDLEWVKSRSVEGSRLRLLLSWMRWRLRTQPAWAAATLGIVAGAIGLWLWLTPSIRVIYQFNLEASRNSGIFLFEEGERRDGSKWPAFAYTVGNNLHIFSPLAKGGRSVELRNFPANDVKTPYLTMVTDVDGDRFADFWIEWSEAGGSLRQDFWGCTARAVPYNREGHRLSPLLSVPGFKFFKKEFGLVSTHLSPLKLIAKGGSGRPEVLARTFTSWGADYSPEWNVFPRGLLCFEARGGSLLWSNALACPSGEIELADIDGDGQEEILLGTASPDNGFKLSDGTDDSHSYLYVFTNTGSLRWRKELGDEFTSVTPVIPKRPAVGEPRVYAWVSCDHANRWAECQKAEVGRILAFDNRGQKLYEKDFATSLQSFLSADWDDGGKQELLAADRFGRIHVLDSKLTLLGTQQIVDTNRAHLVRSINLAEIRACTNVAAHWDWDQRTNGPPRSQTNNCRNPKAHGFTNFQDTACIKFIGVEKMDKSGRPLLALLSWIQEFKTEPEVGNNSSNIIDYEQRDVTLRILDSKLRQVAVLLLNSRSEQTSYDAFLVDWDGDGLQEVLLIQGQDVKVLKLK